MGRVTRRDSAVLEVRKRPLRRRVGWTASSLMAAIGFVGLLVAAHYNPQSASALRGLAMVWLLTVGAVRLLIAFARDG